MFIGRERELATFECLYLRQFHPALPLDQNVCEAFLRPESLLCDEPHADILADFARAMARHRRLCTVSVMRPWDTW